MISLHLQCSSTTHYSTSFWFYYGSRGRKLRETSAVHTSTSALSPLSRKQPITFLKQVSSETKNCFGTDSFCRGWIPRPAHVVHHFLGKSFLQTKIQNQRKHMHMAYNLQHTAYNTSIYHFTCSISRYMSIPATYTWLVIFVINSNTTGSKDDKRIKSLKFNSSFSNFVS